MSNEERKSEKDVRELKRFRLTRRTSAEDVKKKRKDEIIRESRMKVR